MALLYLCLVPWRDHLLERVYLPENLGRCVASYESKRMVRYRRVHPRLGQPLFCKPFYTIHLRIALRLPKAVPNYLPRDRSRGKLRRSVVLVRYPGPNGKPSCIVESWQENQPSLVFSSYCSWFCVSTR